jgi:lipase chaperone protein
MTRKVLTTFLGWRSVGVAAVLLVTTAAGSPAARQRLSEATADALTGPLINASDSPRFRSRGWLRPVRGEQAFEVQFDELMEDLTDGGLRLDREALTSLGQAAVGEDVAFEDLTVGGVLDRVGQVRVRSQGMSVVLGRRTLVRILRNLLGTDARVEDLGVREVLDGLAGAEVTGDGVSGRLDQHALLAAFDGILERVKRPDHAGDPGFDQRRALQLRYGRVAALVRQLRREGFAGVERGQVYDEAYNRLLKAGQADSVPLLDGHLVLEEELAGARLAGLSRPERIASRFEARRKAFGAELAAQLFGRQEAMERYQLDRLAIAGDAALTAEEKASRLQQRREALKVELAALGSYLSFPAAEPVAEPLAAADALAAPDLEVPALRAPDPPGEAPSRGGRRQ